MNKTWIISIALISGCFGAASVASLTPQPTAPSGEQTVPVVPIHSQFRSRTLAHYTGYHAAIDDHFVRSFAAPARNYPALSQLRMNVNATVSDDSLPRYAPGADPFEKVKADRDQHGTQMGALFISDRGLTLNLF